MTRSEMVLYEAQPHVGDTFKVYNRATKETEIALIPI